MSVHNYVHNTPVNSEHGDDYIEDPDPITLISKLDISDPLHLHPNDSTALTVVSIKLKGTENYQVWSCTMLLTLEGKNKTGFIDGSCKRSNTDEVLGRQLDRVNAVVLGWILNSISEKLFLDDSYMLIRSCILSREVLPDVRSAYATISSGESHRVDSSSVSGSSQRSQASAFVSNVPNRNKREVQKSSLCSSSGFTDEQMATLISLIKENKIRKNVQANMAWANQHMTYTDKELDNILDISHFKIKVGHPNGTEAFISKIGNLKLSNGLTLYDVLVILEYYVTLTSVHKLAKENKVVVAFDENKCYFLNQELSLRSVTGIGSQCEGLYYYNNQATEIQRMEQELWTLTLKGDDIEAYNNRFHELALMCHELVPTEKKKIERYVRGFPERIKGNITSSKPATLHDAINMARELVEQSVQGRAARIGESNKRKWEDNQRNNNNNTHNYNNNHNNNNNRNRNNNHHQQQNRRQEAVRAYAAAPTEGKIYAGNLPKCNRCNLHHHGRCPPKCQRCQKMGHLEKDCRVRLQGAGNDFLQNVTCFGCGEKGHFKDSGPEAGEPAALVGGRGRAYVVVENPQQNPNVVTALIDCYEKIVRITLEWQILEFTGTSPEKILGTNNMLTLIKKPLPSPRIDDMFDITSSQVMPFGRQTAAIFMDIMYRCLQASLDNCYCVINDILIYSKSEEEHEAHLKKDDFGLTQEGEVVRQIFKVRILVTRSPVPRTCGQPIGRVTTGRFIENFSIERKAPHLLTQSIRRHLWGDKGKMMLFLNSEDRVGRFALHIMAQAFREALWVRDRHERLTSHRRGQSERTIQTLKDMLRACGNVDPSVMDMKVEKERAYEDRLERCEEVKNKEDHWSKFVKISDKEMSLFMGTRRTPIPEEISASFL
ncbi:ribonuclease H-like domain-containing protein [Tanacetum coccineum]|uniref:Ribonuclease H-like domain-containing protein n=1 Tax=Tanacetum coccineum TaxID=301880 RepID=A0ABQ5GHA5_9ASTR